jgi:hypothetical protein
MIRKIANLALLAIDLAWGVLLVGIGAAFVVGGATGVLWL